MRDRLIELLNKKYDHFCDQCGVNKDSRYTDSLADYLLESGVIVPPIKIGQTVYVVDERRGLWWRGKVISFYYCDENNIQFTVEYNGGEITICDADELFRTKEAADKALIDRIMKIEKKLLSAEIERVICELGEQTARHYQAKVEKEAKKSQKKRR